RARALLWGAADYYWRDEIAWPGGTTSRESAALEMRRAREQWLTLLYRTPPDRWRSLLWRLTHSLLSQEELPSRWEVSRYLAVNRFVRRWWWIAGILIIAASAAASIGCRGPWRFIPAVIVVASITQGVAFGADPRFCLPFLPLLALSLALALPSIKFRRRVSLASGTTALLLLVVVGFVPDTVASDYAIARGVNHV